MVMGRPSKFTPGMVQKICRALELGMTHQRACALAGIHVDTFHEWRNTYPQFSEAVNRAEAECVKRQLNVIEKAAEQGTWQAAAWKLERRYPQEYGRTIQEHSGETRLKVEYVNNWRASGNHQDDESAQGGDDE